MTEAWPEHLLASSHKPWRSLPEEVWERIRQQYLGGVGARELADRYDIGLSTLRQKAREGGWRRTDQSVDSDLFPADADRWTGSAGEEPLDVVEPVVSEADDWLGMVELARLRLRRAVAAGRAAEAASWMRLYERLVARAAAATQPPPETPDEPVAAPRSDERVQDAARIARRIASVAERGLNAIESGDLTSIEALEQELAELEALSARRSSGSSDSSDPLFSGGKEPASGLSP